MVKNGVSLLKERARTMFKKKKKLPNIEFLRDVMGIELTQKRYENLKQLNESGINAESMITALIVLANFRSIQTKPFEGDVGYNSRNNAEDE